MMQYSSLADGLRQTAYTLLLTSAFIVHGTPERLIYSAVDLWRWHARLIERNEMLQEKTDSLIRLVDSLGDGDGVVDGPEKDCLLKRLGVEGYEPYPGGKADVHYFYTDPEFLEVDADNPDVSLRLGEHHLDQLLLHYDGCKS